MHSCHNHDYQNIEGINSILERIGLSRLLGGHGEKR